METFQEQTLPNFIKTNLYLLYVNELQALNKTQTNEMQNIILHYLVVEN